MKVHDSDKHFEALGDADLVEVRIIAATQPHSITGTPSKTPEVLELVSLKSVETLQQS